MTVLGPSPSGSFGASSGDAFASPRSVAERMTHPTDADRQAASQVPFMRPDQVKMIIEKVMLQAFRHLASQRDDVDVVITTDERGWTVRIDMG